MRCMQADDIEGPIMPCGDPAGVGTLTRTLSQSSLEDLQDHPGPAIELPSVPVELRMGQVKIQPHHRPPVVITVTDIPVTVGDNHVMLCVVPARR